LEAAARKTPAPSAPAGEGAVDLVTGDWAGALAPQVAALVEALALPGAQEGTTRMGGAELPATVVADVVLGEFVLHGWDLAKATGRPLPRGPATADAVNAGAAAVAEQARSMGVYARRRPSPARPPH
jgi:uncharacterized protein (TIGR03086 family)